MLRLALVIIAASALIACAGQPQPASQPAAPTPTASAADSPADTTADNAAEPKPAIAKVPFPADVLRAGTPTGTVMVYRWEENGKAPYLRRTAFVETDETGCTFEDVVMDLERNPTGQPTRAQATWAQLEQHAHFPIDSTTLTPETIETPAGRFDATLYQIQAEQNGSQIITRLWFAEGMPGPPVKMEMLVDGAQVMAMVLVERTGK